MLVKGILELGVDLVQTSRCFLPVSKVGDGDSAASSLAKAGVIAVPGSAFGPEGKRAHQTLLCFIQEDLEEALKRMRGIL